TMDRRATAGVLSGVRPADPGDSRRHERGAHDGIADRWLAMEFDLHRRRQAGPPTVAAAERGVHAGVDWFLRDDGDSPAARPPAGRRRYADVATNDRHQRNARE